MSNAYHPKLLFQKDEAERLKWAQIAVDSTTQNAIAFAQAQMASAGFSPHHMDGVNVFIGILLNLSEATPPPTKLPVRQLTSYDMPPPAPPTSTTEPK